MASFDEVRRRSRDPMQEVLERCRRMETRVTQFLESQGFETGVQRPRWNNGVVDVPSPGTSLKYILQAIPQGYMHDVPVYCGREHLCDIMLPK